MEKNLNSPARQLLTALFDDGAYQEIGSYIMEKDAPAGVVTAYGYVNGNPVYAFAQDKSIENGAVGMAQADRFRLDQNIVFSQFGQFLFHKLKMLGRGDIRGQCFHGDPSILSVGFHTVVYSFAISSAVPHRSQSVFSSSEQF